jgi:Tol biopolymer transport system component
MVGLACAALACGTVSSSGGGDDGPDRERPDGAPPGGVDAGLRQPDRLRVFHTVPEEGATRLYSADVIDGEIAPARLLSGGQASAAAIVDDVRISSDGQVVLFTADAESPGQPDLFLVRFDGDEPDPPVRLSEAYGNRYVIDVYLAPDGTGAIFGVGYWGGGFIVIEQYYFVDLSGAAPAAATLLATDDSMFGGTMSQDGSAFAFIRGGSAYAVALDGADPPAAVRVGPAAGTGEQVRSLALAPDGSAIALVGDLTSDDVFELYVSDLSGASPGPIRRASRALVAGGDVDPGVVGIATHFFAPDGGMLAYLADARTDGVTELFVVDVRGATPGTSQSVNGDLVAGGSVSFAWASPFSPDGRMIAYTADQVTNGVSELFVSELSGGAPGVARRVNGALVAGGNVSTFLFAPDGSGLVYRADQRTDDVTEIYFADTRGPEPGPAQRLNGDPVAGGDVSSAVALSGDGGAIAYAGDLMVDARAEPFLAAIDEGTAAPAERVAESSAATSGINSIAFAADGSVVYAGDTARASCDLWIVGRGDATLGEAQRVNTTTATDSGGIHFWLRPLLP